MSVVMKIDNYSEEDIKKILSQPNVKRVIDKVNKDHKNNKEFPNQFNSAGHVLTMKGDLKRYFKGASLRDMVNVATIAMDTLKESSKFNDLYERTMLEGKWSKDELEDARTTVRSVHKKIKNSPMPSVTKTVDWGSTRGQGKRSGHMVKGGMGAGGLSGATEYSGVDYSKYFDKKYIDDFKLLGTDKIQWYWNAREHGLSHLEGMIYATMMYKGLL